MSVSTVYCCKWLNNGILSSFKTESLIDYELKLKELSDTVYEHYRAKGDYYATAWCSSPLKEQGTDSNSSWRSMSSFEHRSGRGGRDSSRKSKGNFIKGFPWQYEKKSTGKDPKSPERSNSPSGLSSSGEYEASSSGRSSNGSSNRSRRSHFSTTSSGYSRSTPVGVRRSSVYHTRDNMTTTKVKQERFYSVIFGLSTGVFDLQGYRNATLNCEYALFKDHSTSEEAMTYYTEQRSKYLEKLISHDNVSEIPRLEGESDEKWLDRAVVYFVDAGYKFFPRTNIRSRKIKVVSLDTVVDESFTDDQLLSQLKEKNVKISSEFEKSYYVVHLKGELHGILNVEELIDVSCEDGFESTKYSSMRDAIVAAMKN